MKAREGSRRFSDPKKKRLAPGEVLRKFGWRRVLVCEKLCRRLQEFGKKLPGVQRVKHHMSCILTMYHHNFLKYLCFIMQLILECHNYVTLIIPT